MYWENSNAVKIEQQKQKRLQQQRLRQQYQKNLHEDLSMLTDNTSQNYPCRKKSSS